jgi:UDP-N-acetyl-D-galactosamine dehydrogenase
MNYSSEDLQNKHIAIIGLGYVGLPLALAFAREFPKVIGFDVNGSKIEELRKGFDRTGETDPEAWKLSSLTFTSDPANLQNTDVFIVAVPTPVDHAHKPDLSFLLQASALVGKVMKPGAVVCFESTVYPGVTEEICGPALAEASGMKQGKDFFLGYSPERINPGDRAHRLEDIVKVVAGENLETLDLLSSLYGSVVKAGIHRAPSIKVAEAAKVIENIQRDLNIALMNELAIVFDRMGLRTADILEAAGTKWNFLPFRPGLVGGHCIGVDPYYLTYKAEELGYIPQVILAGRRINDGMGKVVAEKAVKLLCGSGRSPCSAKVGIVGVTFKEDVPDIRNSRVPDIVEELKNYGISPYVHDPLADPDEVKQEYGITLCSPDTMTGLDAIILAVGHRSYLEAGAEELSKRFKPEGGVFVDVKSLFAPDEFYNPIMYWSL